MSTCSDDQCKSERLASQEHFHFLHDKIDTLELRLQKMMEVQEELKDQLLESECQTNNLDFLLEIARNQIKSFQQKRKKKEKNEEEKEEKEEDSEAKRQRTE
jgi:hypothetical protein